MKLALILAIGIALILVAILVHFESYNWACVIPVDPSMTTSKTPVFALDLDVQKGYNFASEIAASLGVVLTGLAAFRWSGDSVPRRQSD